LISADRGSSSRFGQYYQFESASFSEQGQLSKQPNAVPHWLLAMTDPPWLVCLNISWSAWNPRDFSGLICAAIESCVPTRVGSFAHGFSQDSGDALLQLDYDRSMKPLNQGLETRMSGVCCQIGAPSQSKRRSLEI